MVRRCCEMQRILIIAGAAMILIGLLWPWLSKLPIGRLPGDIHVEKPGGAFYFPITTMLLLSAILSLLAWLFRRW